MVRETAPSRLHGNMSTVRLRALVLVVMALALAACTSSATVSPTTTRPLPAIDLSATPAEWVPVADGDVQLSVPATWWVLYNAGCPTGSPPGEVLVNPVPEFCPGEIAGEGPKNLVWLTLLAGLGSEYKHRSVINGFSVYDDDPGTYFVPSLRLRVTLCGPLGQRVLHTLTRAPRDVALASGPARLVPSSWRSVSFAGLRFSVPLGHSQTRRGVTLPADWTVNQTSETPGLGAICRTPGVALSSTTVTLSTDAHPLPIYYCPVIPPTPQQPENGLQVDSGLSTEPMVTLSFSNRCLSLHGLIVCPATSPAYSILVVKVTVPGRSKPVYVSIGLAGNGLIARTILYGLKEA
jgi:hypothetical protein